MVKQKILDIYATKPTLETPRLFLRNLEPSDWRNLYAYASNPEVSRYLLWDVHHTQAYTKRYLRDLQKLYELGEYFEWGVVLKESGKLIGTCGFSGFMFSRNIGEIGYSFDQEEWGKGYATEAAWETICFGFDVLGLTRIEALFALENAASDHVLQKLHMTYVGEEEPMIIKGVERRIGVYAITRNSYLLYRNI